MSENDSGRVIQSVETALELVGHVRESNGATVTELANSADLSPGAVHTHLKTMQKEGYIVQNGTEYNLGPQFLASGEHVRIYSELYEASKAQVEELAGKSGECAHLIIEHDGKLFAMYERFGSEAVGVELHDRKRTEPLDHLHCTAAGKAILSRLPTARADEIVHSSELCQNTENTLVNPEALKAELGQVRQQGHALADEEQMQGIRAVGVPILGPNETVRGALALSGPISRLQGEFFRQEIPRMVKQAANICEVNLQSANFEEQYM